MNKDKCQCRIWKNGLDNIQCSIKKKDGTDFCWRHIKFGTEWWLGIITEPRPEEPIGPPNNKKPGRHYWNDQENPKKNTKKQLNNENTSSDNTFDGIMSGNSDISYENESKISLETSDSDNNSIEVECEKNIDDNENEIDDFNELSINITKSLTKKDKKDGGIFFTPKTIIKQDIDYILSIKSDIKTILEPSCGSCEFINYIDRRITECDIDCVELNKNIYDKIKGLKFKNKVLIKNEDFLKLDIDKRYDLICGNPPYFVYGKDKIPSEYKKYITGRANIFLIFILKCIDLLEEDGILSFVLPCNFLNCSYYNLVRVKIQEEFNILKIINHNSDTYLDTEQNTCSLIIQKNIQKKPLYYKKIHDMVIFNSTENINKLDLLQENSTTLDKMDFKVFVGRCVWNQVKELLTEDTTKTLLVYNGDIKNNKLNPVKYKNPDKKNYINKSGETGPLLVVNRGYGIGNYSFNYCLIDIEGEYLIENHLICIKSKTDMDKEILLKKYDTIIKSFNNPKTKEFIKLYFTNDAINTHELQYVFPIYV